MKKTIFAILIILCLSMSLTACGEKTNDKPEGTNQTDADVDAAKDEEESNDAKEGLDLIESMGTDRPETLKFVSEVTALNTTTTMTIFYDGDKSRTEIDVANMPKSILIHIPSENIMYQYVHGESTGIKITGADQSSAEEMGLMIDTSLLTSLTTDASDDITARTEYLDSEEVIYIETTETDEEVGKMLVKMWYSERYAMPLKYEVYVDDALMSELKVTEIQDNVNFDADTFAPPADITFQEVDMDAMTNMW